MGIILNVEGATGEPSDALTLAQLILEVKDELGADIAALFTDDDEYARYLNQGQRRLQHYAEDFADLSWPSGARDVALPVDLALVDRIIPYVGVRVPEHKVFGSALRFLDPEGAVSDGTARLYYYAHPTEITVAAASTLPSNGNTAIVAFACYRFFRRLVSSRADYQRYSTLLGQNGVDIEELASVADDYFAEFESARDSIPNEEPATYYGD